MYHDNCHRNYVVTLLPRPENMIHPWNQTLWQRLEKNIAQGRLPHALMLCGPQGLGKYAFAKALAAKVITERPELIDEGSHPDYFEVLPEDRAHAIKVDQIRLLSQKLNQTAQYNGYQVAIIHPAQNMNVQAANALLKTLEEPPGQVLIVLICDQLGNLPATILSRCQKLDFYYQPSGEAKAWLRSELSEEAELYLKLANDAPLRAVELSKENVLEQRDTVLKALIHFSQRKLSVVASAKALADVDKLRLMYLLSLITQDLLKLAAGATDDTMINIDRLDALKRFVAKFSLEQLQSWDKALAQAQNLIARGANINLGLLLENLLLSYEHTNIQTYGHTC